MSFSAYDTATILPEGIRNLAIKQGNYASLNQTFGSSGNLQYLGDSKSVELNLSTLKGFSPRVEELARAIDAFSSQNIGSQIHLGYLQIKTDPEVRFRAPVLAYGLSSKWTVGVGIPIISYTNDIQLSHSGSNIDEIKRQLQGGGVPREIQDGLTELSQPVVPLVESTMAQMGYKPFGKRDETFIGDIQVVGLYNFLSSDTWSSTVRFSLGLPTGPKDDPDDLGDLDQFGRWSLETAGILSRKWSPLWMTHSKLSYMLTPSQSVEKRIPTTRGEAFIPVTQKDTISRDAGDSWTGAQVFEYYVRPWLSLGTGIEYIFKGEDRFSNSSKGNSELLSEGTSSSSLNSIFAVNISTIELFQLKGRFLPLYLMYQFSDTLQGVNTERKKTHELSLSLFF